MSENGSNGFGKYPNIWRRTARMIYLVEDDNNIRELVVYTLNNTGMETIGFDRPTAFWNALEYVHPDLILLDIMLPEEDGLSILKKLRASQKFGGIPIMMLTAKGSEYDKVIGLDLGADDYIPKPFGMMELIARIKALLRRTEHGGMSRENQMKSGRGEYKIGELYVSPARHLVKVGDGEITLTLKEFDMLCLLLEHKGMVMTRDQILNKVWGYAFDGESRTVDVHIRTLRQKLLGAGDLIETIRGVGYRIGERL